MMGTIAASPFLESHPEVATAFMFGSVLPDLDVLSRLVCRGLRTRNFKTRFGQLDLLLSSSGQVLNRVFHV